MKRRKKEEKELLEGLEWASPTDKVYNSRFWWLSGFSSNADLPVKS